MSGYEWLNRIIVHKGRNDSEVIPLFCWMSNTRRKSELTLVALNLCSDAVLKRYHEEAKLHSEKRWNVHQPSMRNNHHKWTSSTLRVDPSIDKQPNVNTTLQKWKPQWREYNDAENMKCSYFYQNDRNGANHCEFPSRGLCHFSINVTDDSVIEETSILTNSWVLSIELRDWWKVNAPFQMMCVRCARVLRSVDRFATFIFGWWRSQSEKKKCETAADWDFIEKWYPHTSSKKRMFEPLWLYPPQIQKDKVSEDDCTTTYMAIPSQ